MKPVTGNTVIDKNILRIARGASVSSKKNVFDAFDALGIKYEVIEKLHRSPVKLKLTLPGEAPVVIEDGFNPGRKLSPEAITYPRCKFVGAHARQNPHVETIEALAYNAAVEGLGKRIQLVAATALGIENEVRRRHQGLPSADRSEDPAVRTCPWCFRDIKATAAPNSDGRSVNGIRIKVGGGPGYDRIVDHGFSVEGRDWSGTGGVRQGRCPGVGMLPLEESRSGLETALAELEKRSETTKLRLERIEAALCLYMRGYNSTTPVFGDYAEFATQRVRGARLKDRKGGPRRDGYEYDDVGPTDYRWKQAMDRKRNAAQGFLRSAWGTSFGSIPWFRGAVAQWKEQASTVTPCMGAPLVDLSLGDYTAGRVDVVVLRASIKATVSVLVPGTDLETAMQHPESGQETAPKSAEPEPAYTFEAAAKLFRSLADSGAIVTYVDPRVDNNQSVEGYSPEEIKAVYDAFFNTPTGAPDA